MWKSGSFNHSVWAGIWLVFVAPNTILKESFTFDCCMWNAWKILRFERLMSNERTHLYSPIWRSRWKRQQWQWQCLRQSDKRYIVYMYTAKFNGMKWMHRNKRFSEKIRANIWYRWCRCRRHCRCRRFQFPRINGNGAMVSANNNKTIQQCALCSRCSCTLFHFRLSCQRLHVTTFS